MSQFYIVYKKPRCRKNSHTFVNASCVCEANEKLREKLGLPSLNIISTSEV